MKRYNRLMNNTARQRGQSLVEVALFFPIFIIMLAGLVEVSNLLVTQNRVTSAARASTRFAANGGQDEGMTSTLLNNVTQTLNADETVWDVFSIRGEVDDSGQGIALDTWQFNHIYGVSNTIKSADIDASSIIAIQGEILQQLQRDEFGSTHPENAAGLRFVGTYAIHDVDSILGLNAIPELVGFTSVRELAVMRVIGYDLEATDGCEGFPIAVHEGARSVTPTGQGANPFPNSGEFDGPGPYPTYNQFYNHRPDVPLLDAKEGYVYKVQNGAGNGNFGWLVWNEGVNSSAQTLNGSLSWPGNSKDYVSVAPGQTLPGFSHPVYGYVEPGDPSDTEMQIDDWVAGSTGSVNANQVRNTIEGHMTYGRTLRLIIWNEAAGQGTNLRYHISGFAIFRLLGYHLSQNQGESWILAEFIRWDNSCGQVATGP